MASPPEGALEGPRQLLGGATALMAVLVAEAAFHSGDLAGEPAHGALHHGLDSVGELVVRGTVAVGLARHSQASLLPA